MIDYNCIRGTEVYSNGYWRKICVFVSLSVGFAILKFKQIMIKLAIHWEK